MHARARAASPVPAVYRARVPESASPLKRLYPETAVGGYSRMDGTVEFYNRVKALTGRDSEVLDFGAGRGQWAESRYSERAFDLQWLKGTVRRVVGSDVDDAVLSNPSLDDAVLLTVGEPLPFADGSFDVIIADYVLEHIPADEAERVAGELSRVLRPGGWLAARTPNRRHHRTRRPPHTEPTPCEGVASIAARPRRSGCVSDRLCDEHDRHIAPPLP